MCGGFNCEMWQFAAMKLDAAGFSLVHEMYYINTRLPCILLIALPCLLCSHTSRGISLHTRWWSLPSVPRAPRCSYKQGRKMPFRPLTGFAKGANSRSLWQQGFCLLSPYKCAMSSVEVLSQCCRTEKKEQRMENRAGGLSDYHPGKPQGATKQQSALPKDIQDGWTKSSLPSADMLV